MFRLAVVISLVLSGLTANAARMGESYTVREALNDMVQLSQRYDLVILIERDQTSMTYYSAQHLPQAKTVRVNLGRPDRQTPRGVFSVDSFVPRALAGPAYGRSTVLYNVVRFNQGLSISYYEVNNLPARKVGFHHTMGTVFADKPVAKEIYQLVEKVGPENVIILVN